jgi:uncharacterized protein involved in oxidation of intracellular sulfur
MRRIAERYMFRLGGVHMKILFVLNDAPYGSERFFNGLRLAREVAGRDEAEVRVFLMGDSVGSAIAGQKLPDGYYHLDRMLGSLGRRGVTVGACSTCLDARGFTDAMLIDAVHRSTLEDLGNWTLWADKVVTF